MLRLLEMEASLGQGADSRLTKAGAQAFRKRWVAVNAAEREELVTTPIDHKFHQLAALMTSAEKLGWTETLASEESQVRDRWTKLRRLYHA
jgi:hypothetical protein